MQVRREWKRITNSCEIQSSSHPTKYKVQSTTGSDIDR